uniref:Uncharacterized protein n=1 Tax=Accipiter nisus TaxID=211598 RepID=A0A8B9LZ27_9AVES
MLDPSSSEEESDELLEEERRDALVAAGGGSPRSLPPPARDPRGREAGAARAASPSPSPSVLSEGREEQERLQREEREKRLRLQLYVFVARCIAHPFNAKQPTDMARRQQKVSPRPSPCALPRRPPSPPAGPSRVRPPARRPPRSGPQQVEAGAWSGARAGRGEPPPAPIGSAERRASSASRSWVSARLLRPGPCARRSLSRQA